MNQEGKYLFKAPFKIKDKKGLLKLLKQQDLKGLGGIMLEDVQESLPHCEKALKVRDKYSLHVIITSDDQPPVRSGKQLR